MTKFIIVKKHIDEIDHYSLLASNAPCDEFDSESRKICDKITCDYTVQEIASVIAEIFSRSFGEDYDIGIFIDCARKIYTDLHC